MSFTDGEDKLGSIVARCGIELHLVASLFSLLHLDEGTNGTDLVVAMSVEVETPLLRHAELHQVVIERLFGDFHLGGGFFKGHLDDYTVSFEASVEQAPQTDFLNDLLDGAFFDTRTSVRVKVDG